MLKKSKPFLATFTVLSLFFGTLAAAGGNASASSIQREGQLGNNLVCGGVHTLAKAIYIARGGSVKCANGTVERGIGKVWAAEGMTLQVIERMKFGTICASQGYLSSGREMGPDPSKNVHRDVVGISFYTRPLLVWGPGCYQALKGFTENGEAVGILTGCGNGEMRYYPPNGPSPVRTVACVLNGTPERSVPVGYTVQNGNCVSIAAQACVVNYGGQWNSVTGICSVTQGNCNTFIVLNGSSGNVVNITYSNSCDTIITPPPIVPPTTTTTTTLPPPTPQPPSILGVTLPESDEVQIAGTSPMQANITAPVGDSLTVYFTAVEGSFASASVSAVSSAGETIVYDTYSAPLNANDAGTYDSYTVQVYDSTTKLWSAVVPSGSFKLIAPTTNYPG